MTDALRTDQCSHLYQEHLRELFGRCLTCEIEELQKQVRQLRKEHAAEVREMQRESLDIAAEAVWKDRQGDEYGSY